MNRVYGSIKIKSNWFNSKQKNRKILKIGHKGLYLYLTLGKCRLVRPTNNVEFIFHVTIDWLRKETGYSTNEVIELLKLLINQKIIKLKKPSRWDRLYDKNGILQDKEMLTFIAVDVPVTDSLIENNMSIDKPRTLDDYFISIDLDMIEHYKSIGLSERYFSLYCLLRKLSNGIERKAFMTIHNMAETLGVHHDTIHKYIKILNTKLLLCSVKKMGRKGYHFEHILGGSVLGYDDFLRAHQEIMLRNAKRWESKVSDTEKVISNNGNDLNVETVEENWNENFEYYKN